MAYLYQGIQRRFIVIVAIAVLFFSVPVSYAGINDDLHLIDVQIQSQPNPVRVTGQAAYNVYEGVTQSRLAAKIALLKTTSISNRFYQKWDTTLSQYVPVYDNFYSFTGLAGVTDTKLDVVTTAATQRLYRRGKTGTMETATYLGAWWGDQYRGVQASRDEQAILAAWGSDLQRIYVIDVPAGYTLVGGIASPMEKDGEYRAGGAYQYYFSGAVNSWLVYALYAPDYMKSYSGAVTSAQKAGRSIATDLGTHLNQTRHEGICFDAGAREQPAQEGRFWLRGFGGNTDFGEVDGSSANAQTTGMSFGWQRMTQGGRPTDKSRSYFGAMLGQGNNYQKYGTSNYGTGNVENKTQATVGGIYGLYVNRPDSSRSWYGNWSLLHGSLKFNNTVPGELGYGLQQEYNGNITMLTVENGVSFRQPNGWVLEPQLQLSYTKIGQNDFNDKLGARVSLKQGDSFWGRLGMEARRITVHDSNRQSQYWARFSYIHDFSNRNEVDIAGDRATSELNRGSCVLAVGADLKLSPQYSLQGEVAQVFGSEKGFQGNLALQYAW